MKNCIVGDIHGHYTRLTELLHDSSLVNDHLEWTGGQSTLWFTGDFFDRGPDGVSAVSLVMRLEHEARAAGGRVQALLGNHDVLLLAVLRFGKMNDRIRQGESIEASDADWFTALWLRNGGTLTDLVRLTSEQADWLTNLPAMVKEDDRIFTHADAMLYLHYGTSITAVNDKFINILHSDDYQSWDLSLDQFGEHKGFYSDKAKARRFLNVFDGRQIVHGHTPIMNITDQPPEKVTEPLIYANGRCVNVDHGLYRGGPGFIYELPEE